MIERPRVVVCGTGFGRIYLAGIGAAGSPFELAGVLARGSARSRACARRYGVPLFTRVDEVPADVDIACVVVGSAINGGPGGRLAMELMERGIHVLQEHPLHPDELAACLRAAREHGVHYRVNTHHVHVAAVRRFIVTARAVTREQPPLFVDAAASFQVLGTLFDIVGEALGRLRPWGFAAVDLPPRVRSLTPLDPPFRSLDGVLAGVPTTLRVQNQMDPSEPDNHGHVWHRITIGTEGGDLTLAGSNGPVIWCVRPHMPPDAGAETGFDRLGDADLGLRSAGPIGPADAVTWTGMLVEEWPAAVRRAVGELWDGVVRGADPLRSAQYHLALGQLTRDVTDALGPVRLVRRDAPRVLGVEDVAKLASEWDDEVRA